MAVVPEDGEVLVHLAGCGQQEVLEVAVVRGGEDDGAAGFEQGEAVAEEAAGVVDVLDDLGGDDDVDGADCIEELGVERLGIGEKKVDIGVGFAGELDAGGREIGAVELPVSVLKEGDEGAVAATGVHNDGAFGDVGEEAGDGWIEMLMADFGIGCAVLVRNSTHIF